VKRERAAPKPRRSKRPAASRQPPRSAAQAAAGPTAGPVRDKRPATSRKTAKPAAGAAPEAAPGKRPAASRQPRRATPQPAAGPARGLWLYGRHTVEAALANPQRSCHRLLGTPEGLASLGRALRRPGLEVTSVEREELERRLGAGAVHQGLALSVAPLPRADLKRACAPEAGRNLVLLLDQISDPHNVGAILRSAAAFEVRAVVCPERRSAELGGALAKAASGALDLVPVVEVTNLARALDELAALGYWRIALDGAAEAAIDQVPEVDNLALVLGAEGSGVRRLVRERCDLVARLPIAPAMESLNVSVACGIALYALARRRGGA